MFAKDIPAGDVQTYLIEYRCDTSRGDWKANGDKFAVDGCDWKRWNWYTPQN